MNIREKSAMVYRTIFVKAWAENLGVQSQALRELHIQAEKLNRMCWRWDHHFLDRCNSLKKAERMQLRNDRQIVPQYQKVLSLVEKIANERARQKGLNDAWARGQMYGTDGLVSKADVYAKKHAIK